MPVAVSVAVAVAVSVAVGPTLPAASAAARAPSAGPPAVPGRYFISEPRHSVDTESQSSRSSGERDQCSVVVQPHNITSHLDRNVSYARRVGGVVVVGGKGGSCGLPNTSGFSRRGRPSEPCSPLLRASCGCEGIKRDVVRFGGASALSVPGWGGCGGKKKAGFLKSRGDGRLHVLRGSPQSAPQPPDLSPHSHDSLEMTA